MSKTPTRPIKYEKERKYYAEVLTEELRDQLFAVADATRLEASMLNLVIAWKCASNCLTLPDIIASSAPLALATYSKKQWPREGELVKALVAAMATDLSRDFRVDLTRPQRQSVTSWARSKLKEIDAALVPDPAPSIDASWDSYIKIMAFKSSIVGLTGYAYVASYFAYESYLASVVKVVTGTWHSSTRALERAVRETWPATASDLWDAPIVVAARHVRDGYVHRGGGLRPGVEGAVSDFVEIKDGFALVTAREVSALMPELVRRVLDATEAVKRDHAAETAS